MKVKEIVPGQSYRTAVEIPLGQKYREVSNGTHKSGGNNSGSLKRKAGRVQKGAGLQYLADTLKLARQQTENNKMMLVVDGTGKKHWRRVNEWSAAKNASTTRPVS